MKNPDFICIGAQKAGTTWLFNNLKDHPSVKLPFLKELHYFDELHRGVKRDLFNRFFGKHWMNAWWRHNLPRRYFDSIKEANPLKFVWFTIYFFLPRNIFWYRLLFPPDSNKVTGEFTPDYSIISTEQIKTIKSKFPNVKIILLLRDPIETDWSHVRMVYLRKQRVGSLDNVPNADIIHTLKYRNPLTNYPMILKNWLSVFPPEQVFIGFHDEIKQCPELLLSNILSYLSLPNIFSSKQAKTTFNVGLTGNLNAEFREILADAHKEDMDYLEDYFSFLKINYPRQWKEKHYH